MYKITTSDNKNNIAGRHIRIFRLEKGVPLREFAGFLQLNGLDWDYNQLDRAEKEFVQLMILKLVCCLKF